jgi:uncharacterized protein YgbK (DUF1537 family)
MRPHTLARPQPVSSAAGPIFILADDLTGACDSAVAFVVSGRSVHLILDVDSVTATSSPPDSVIAITTETRGLPDRQQAADRVAHITGLLSETPAAILFKKVDSAARGHFGPETLAALNASGAALALVAPAFPQAGRVVKAGLLTIRDAAGQNATIALRDLFPQVEDAHIDTLPVGPIVELEQGIARAIAAGIRVLLCDAQMQTDLDRLARAASRFCQPILWTGSAGLAHALARAVPPVRPAARISPEPGQGRTLLFIGTDHPVTMLQLAYLAAHPPDHPYAVHSIDWTRMLPQQIRAAFAAAPTAALVLSGGETAAYVLQALHASRILLAGEHTPGVPWGILEGGDADGCIVVTKSGGFGAEHALVEAVHICVQHSTRRAHASA